MHLSCVKICGGVTESYIKGMFNLMWNFPIKFAACNPTFIIAVSMQPESGHGLAESFVFPVAS